MSERETPWKATIVISGFTGDDFAPQVGDRDWRIGDIQCEVVQVASRAPIGYPFAGRLDVTEWEVTLERVC